LLASAEFERGLESYQNAERLALELADVARIRRARHGQSWVLGSLGRHTEALAAAESARELAAGSGDHAAAAVSDMIMDRARYRLGDFAKCGAARSVWADAVVALGRVAPAEPRFMDIRVYANMFLVQALASRGDFAGAITIGRDMLETAARVGRAS